MATEASYHAAQEAGDHQGAAGYRKQYRAILSRALPDEDVNDTNYIFLRFVRGKPAGRFDRDHLRDHLLSVGEVSRRRLIPGGLYDG